MDFKIVPFTAKISRDSNAASVADQIQSAINLYNSQGWEYLRMESVQTSVAGSSGCFGIGAQPGFTTIFNVLVFRKN
jgi:hypothetical protein